MPISLELAISLVRDLSGETGENTKHPCPTDSSFLIPYNAQHVVGVGFYDYPGQENARKRRRIQVTEEIVSNFFGGNSNKSKAPSLSDPNARPRSRGAGSSSSHRKRPSQAKPRPSINIQPRGIGPILDPNCNDVLSGRGGRINAHAGNVQFRNLVHSKRNHYLNLQTKKLEKAYIAAEIVRHVRTMEPPGRFLKEDADGVWYDIGDAKAIKKVGQALREDAPEMRQEVGGPDGPTEQSRYL